MFKIICPYCEEAIKVIVVYTTAANDRQVLTIYEPHTATIDEPKRR